MLELCIRCPVCGKYHYYSLGDDDVHNIGDIVGPDYEYYSQSYNEKCRSCKNEFLIVELVHRGQLVNVLINPTEEEDEKIEDRIYPLLDAYPDLPKYHYYERLNMLLGEDSRVIPSQYFLVDLKVGDKIPLFTTEWEVKEKYKVIDDKKRLISKIYKVSEIRKFSGEKIERLLILRDNLLPTLKIVDWGVTSFLDEEERFKKYRIPPNCKLFIDLT